MVQLNIRPEDADALGRIAYAEAGNQGPQGLAGVMFAVLNRLASNRWGSSMSDVLNSKNQFEPIGRAGGDWRNLPRLQADQQGTASNLLNLIASGQVQDPTGGATFFQNPAITQQRGTDFSAGNPGKRIGDHVFYDRYKGGAPVGVPDWTLALTQGMAGAQPPSGDVYGGQGANMVQGGAGADLLPGQVPPSEYALSLPDLMAKLAGQGVKGFNFGGKAYAATPGEADPYKVTYDRFAGGAPSTGSGASPGAYPGLIGGPIPGDGASLNGGPIPGPSLNGGPLPGPAGPSPQEGLTAALGGNGMPPVTSRIMDMLFNAPPSNPAAPQAAPAPNPMQAPPQAGSPPQAQPQAGSPPQAPPPSIQGLAHPGGGPDQIGAGPGAANIGQTLKDLASALLAGPPQSFNQGLMAPGPAGPEQTGVSAGAASLGDLAGRLFTDPSTFPQVNPPTGKRPARQPSPQDQIRGYTGM